MVTDQNNTVTRIIGLVVDKGLESDEGLYELIRYYAKLKESGNGELSVKLLKGKLSVKGVNYIMVD